MAKYDSPEAKAARAAKGSTNNSATSSPVDSGSSKTSTPSNQTNQDNTSTSAQKQTAAKKPEQTLITYVDKTGVTRTMSPHSRGREPRSSSSSSTSRTNTPSASAQLNYGYGRTREGNQYRYYDSSGKEVSASEAVASGGRPVGGGGVGTRSPYTGNVIAEYIDLDKGTSTKTAAPKTYVDPSGVIRQEGQTGYKEFEYEAAQVVGKTGKSGAPSLSELGKNETARLGEYAAYKQSLAQQQVQKAIAPLTQMQEIQEGVRQQYEREKQAEINPITGRPYTLLTENVDARSPLQKFEDTLFTKQAEAQQAAKKTGSFKDITKSTAYGLATVGAGAIRFGVVEPAKFVYGAFSYAGTLQRDPKLAFTQAQTVTKTILSPSYWEEQRQLFEQTVKERPGYVIGGVIGTIKSPQINVRIAEGLNVVATKVIKEPYLKSLNVPKVAPEATFAEDVLAGKQKFPLSSSVSESVESFISSKTSLIQKEIQAGQKIDSAAVDIALQENIPSTGTIRVAPTTQDIYVTTASPAKISGDVVEKGARAKLGTEDPGLYVTPNTKTSPLFLRIGQTEQYTYGVGINPLSVLSPYKKIFQTPTVTEIKATGVTTIPTKVKSAAGFKEVEKFFETKGSKTGKVYITKRSELGQGELKKQINPATGKLEQGTSELESVVPYKTYLDETPGIVGITEYKGRIVAIRQKEIKALVVDKPKQKVAMPKEKITKTSAESSSILKEPVKVSPLSYVSQIKGKRTKPIGSSDDTVTSDVGVSGKIGEESGASVSQYENTQLSSNVATSAGSSVTSTGSALSVTTSPVSEPTVSNVSLTPTSSTNYSQKYDSKDFVSQGTGGAYTNYQTQKQIPISTKTTRRRQRQQKERSFAIAIRRKGKFATLTPTFATKQEAFEYGATSVGQTAAATFTIKEVQREATKAFKGKVRPEDFYGKVEKGEQLYIQKASKRISSMGEKREITAKGILASRAKASRKRGILG